MNSWMIFLIGSVLLTLALAGGTILHRRKHALDFSDQASVHDARLLIFLVWLASLSILAYIAFAFGKQ